jgi:hypothetical protein
MLLFGFLLLYAMLTVKDGLLHNREAEFGQGFDTMAFFDNALGF